MGRSHLLHICFNGSSISDIILQMIEIDQMPAGAIHHETEHLFEKLCNVSTFFTFSQRTEKPVQHRKYLNAMQIGRKECQAGPSSQFLACWLHVIDFQFAFTINFVILRHLVLHLLGYALWLILLCRYCNNIRNILKGGGLFLAQNRLS